MVIGLCVLLLLRGVMPHARPSILLSLTLILGVSSYLLLSGLRPRLPLLFFAVIAAELGLLYSLPYQLLYGVMWHDIWLMLDVLTLTLMALFFALLLGVWLEMKQYAAEVIGLCFLVMFVFVNLVYIVPH